MYNNICAYCHKLKPDNPSRCHYACWTKFAAKSKVEHNIKMAAQARRMAADARIAGGGTNINGEGAK